MRLSFVQTIRFRLTVLYSSLLFLLCALVVGLLYVAVARSAEERPYTVQQAKLYSVDTERYVGRAPVVELAEVENAVNLLTLRTLRDYSFLTLGGLFLASFGIGWVLWGRVLRPVRSITRAAAEIQGTDLSRRILLTGPKDELRDLADTVDTVLGRLEGAFLAQRWLIDDASHELRSPLAVIRANVDAVLASPGSTEDDHARVFDRFWRGQTSRRDRHSGLGLAIVRQIVESHGGHVRLFSRPGEGSVFVLWPPSGEGPAEGEVPGLNPLAEAGLAGR
ncbi:ATP-binding protein [Streptosporangium sp. NPDC048865]|uniref:sensor histidine kinase n=1 Tax=Streptosporangium sp. NPDC048865 TaxID=3155766 RepID=UPI0034282112